jgi:hypothetical protein
MLYMELPLSVVGGASKSGFCLSRATSAGPRMVAPKLPLMAWGSVLVLGSQRGPLGLLPVSGTVERGPPLDVVEVGSPGAKEDTTEEAGRGTLRLLLTTTDELLPAGAAKPKLANKTEQTIADENLDMLCRGDCLFQANKSSFILEKAAIIFGCGATLRDERWQSAEFVPQVPLDDCDVSADRDLSQWKLNGWTCAVLEPYAK